MRITSASLPDDTMRHRVCMQFGSNIVLSACLQRRLLLSGACLLACCQGLSSACIRGAATAAYLADGATALLVNTRNS